ncbi:hypothetical protein CGSMWGv6420B_03329 [Gardnerella vaginalis 6420B]|nr:hypothetical protein CGSMWGv6420B_03329 [Gardnerella vaginalis 6420B]
MNYTVASLPDSMLKMFEIGLARKDMVCCTGSS